MPSRVVRRVSGGKEPEVEEGQEARRTEERRERRRGLGRTEREEGGRLP